MRAVGGSHEDSGARDDASIIELDSAKLVVLDDEP